MLSLTEENGFGYFLDYIEKSAYVIEVQREVGIFWGRIERVTGD